MAKVPKIEERAIPEVPKVPEVPVMLEPRYFYPVPERRIVWFSIRELKELAFATILILLVGLSLKEAFPFIGIPLTQALMLGIIFTLSFLLHEIAHKFTAQGYGYWAEFRLFPTGVLLTGLSIFLPIKFIAPGAVLVAGPIVIEGYGKTALAGPLVNIILGIIFCALHVTGITPFLWGALFNAYIALFNLIPFGIFDGEKVFRWSKIVWAISFAIALLMLISILHA